MSKGGTNKKFKLYYFDARGRAEVIRLIFAEAGVEYEDNRLQKEEWAQMKEKTPTGLMPLLEVDGEMLAETMAIVRYLAKEFGLDRKGSDNFEQGKMDMVMDVCCDILKELGTFLFEKDSQRKEELKKKFSESLPKRMEFFEKMLDKGENGFFFGNKLTVVDIVAYDLFCKMSSTGSKLSPKVEKHMNKIGTMPNIQGWVQKRPKTEM